MELKDEEKYGHHLEDKIYEVQEENNILKSDVTKANSSSKTLTCVLFPLRIWTFPRQTSHLLPFKRPKSRRGYRTAWPGH